MRRAVRVRVSGEVQGVSFRGFTAREAVRLELLGWVRNDDDGSVVAHLEGPEEDVEEMVQWLHHGSPKAHVRDVEVEDTEPTGVNTFEVRY